MTVFTNAGKTAKPNNPYYSTGKLVRQVEARFSELAAAVADGDTFILAEGLSYADRIDSVVAEGGVIALTSADDNDLGFYQKNDDGTLTEIDKDILFDGVDLSSGISGWADLLNQNTSLDREDSIGDLLSKSVEDQKSNVCLVLTINTKSTATSTILNIKTRIEEANTQ